MKTLKDFDMTLYRKEIWKYKEDMGLSEEECEGLLLEFLEHAKNQLNSKAHCLTCGVKFPLSDFEHECQKEDIWLYGYVQNSVLNKEINTRHISLLKEKYPLKEDTIAFRGINFQTKEAYDKFMKEIETGTVLFPTISSWSLKYSYAKRFASVTQKGTRANDEDRKDALRLLAKEKSNITGYKGVVIAIDVTKKIVLCDISEAYIGSMDEKELILFPGTYQVTWIKEIEKEVGIIDWDEELLKEAELL